MKSPMGLYDDEVLRWEGRPAPRCYTFRHWRHSIFGIIFLAICSLWQVLGIEMAEDYETVWLAWLPLPFLLYGGYLACGHLLQARLEWNHVHYVITDRRLLIKRGLLKSRVEVMALDEMTYFRLDLQGEELGTLRVYQGLEKQLILHCLEHPRRATELLEAVLSRGLPRGDSALPDLGRESGDALTPLAKGEDIRA